MKLLKTSVHEKCPKSARKEAIFNITGHGSLKSFSNYLVHLRTANHFNNPTCKSFTLTPGEYAEFKSLQSVSTSKICTRNSTRLQTEASLTNKARLNLEKKLGVVKTFILRLAIERNWVEQDFRLGKTDLRRIYEVDRKIPSIQHNLPKHELLSYLKTVSFIDNSTSQ